MNLDLAQAERGIQSWNHATYGMEMCSAIRNSTRASILNCPGSDRVTVLHSVFYGFYRKTCLRKFERSKNVEKAEMSQKRSAQKEHGKHES